MLIPLAYHIMSSSDFVKYSTFFLYSFVLGVVLDFGFRQKVLNKRLESTFSFLSYGRKIMLPITLICASVLIATSIAGESNMFIVTVVISLAAVDAILQLIIANGYLTNLLVFNLEEKFKKFSTIYGIYFFSVRLIAILIVRQVILVLIVILISKLIAIALLQRLSEYLKIDRINDEAQGQFIFKDQYSNNSIFSVSTLLILSSDRIIGSAYLSDEEIAKFFLISQYVGALSSVSEQYIFLHFKKLVKAFESVEKVPYLVSSWIVIVPLTSYLGAYLLNLVYNWKISSAFITIFFQLLNVLLWLLYSVLILSINTNINYFKVNTKIHVFCSIFNIALWYINFRFSMITFSSLASIVYLSFGLLITLQLSLGTPQIRRQLRLRLLGHILLANFVGLFVLLLNQFERESILFSCYISISLLQLICFFRLIRLRSWK